MAKNKSSFHMGDEFNGSGKKTYLKATQHNTYVPLSQDNIKLTPDFRKYIPKAIGAMPITSGSAMENLGLAIRAVGSFPVIERIIVKKDTETNQYQTSFHIRKKNLTTGSYLYSKKGSHFQNEKTLEQITVKPQKMEFKGKSFLVAVEKEIPYIYSTLEYDPNAENNYPEWTGDFNSQMDLTFGIGHSIKTQEEFDYFKQKVDKFRDNEKTMTFLVNYTFNNDIKGFVDSVNDFCFPTTDSQQENIEDQYIYLTQNQFDAIVILLYNCGFNLKGSKLGNELESQKGKKNPEFNEENIKEGFRYTVYNESRSEGLTTRRNNELNLFFNNDYNYYDSKELVIQQGIGYIDYP